MSQYYQDTLTEEERWQEAEDERLEYEGYCNKIRKGLEDLDEKSGERAIWELVQNAVSGNFASAEIGSFSFGRNRQD